MADTSASAYLSYKNDTMVFLSWLGQSSERYGWKSRQARKEAVPTVQITVKSSGRLKGKERKKVKDAAELEAKRLLEKARKAASKKILSVAEVAQQIELVDRAITEEKEEQMPFNVWKALQRSIKARERFSRWYKASQSCPKDKLESHDYFIDALKKATCLARGEYDKNRLKKPFSNQTNRNNTLTNLNVFEYLEVDDLSGLDEPNIPGNEGDQTNISGEDRTVKFDIEPMVAEMEFAFFAVFEDIRRVRAETQRVFRRLMADEICLLNATVSIGVAFDLIRKAEDEAMRVADMVTSVHSESEKLFTEFGAYSAMSQMFMANRETGKEDGVTTRLVSSDEFDEFILYPLGLTLMDIRLRPPNLRAFQFGRYPFATLAKHYGDSLEELNKPRVQKGLKEDQILKHFYYEMKIIEDIGKGRVNFCTPTYKTKDYSDNDIDKFILPFYDLFHNALRPIWQQKKISFESAFAARVMLDMCEICGTSLHNSLLQPKEVAIYASRYGVGGAKAKLEIPCEDKDLSEKLFQIRWRTSVELSDKPFWVITRSCITKRWKSERQERVKKEKDVIWPHESHTFMLDNNLLYDGTAILDLITRSELVEIKLANFHFSIFCVAHIYNAARQLAGLDISWPKMDQVIELQKGPIFANDVPTTPKEVLRRFTYRTGLSAERRFRRTLMGSGPRSWKLQPTATSLIIHEYFEGKISLPRMVYKLQEQATQYEKARKQHSQASDRPSSMPSTAKGDQQQVTIAKTLQIVEEYMDSMLPDMQFDYMNLTRTCNRLMMSLRQELMTDLGVRYMFYYGETYLRSFVHAEVAHRIVLENLTYSTTCDVVIDKLKRMGELKDPNIKINTAGRQLKHATGFPRKFITDELSHGSESQGDPA